MQAGWHVRLLLPGPPHLLAAKPVLLRGEQPLRGTRGKILHARNLKREVPFDNATAHPLEMLINHPLDK